MKGVVVAVFYYYIHLYSMENSISFSGSGAVCIFVLVILQKLLPYKEGVTSSGKSFKELRDAYWLFSIKYSVFTLILTVVFGVICIEILALLVHAKYSAYQEEVALGAALFVSPSVYLICLLSGFMGLYFSAISLLYCMKKELGEYFEEYYEYMSRVYKVNYKKLTYFVMYTFSVIVVLLAVVTFDSYSYFGQSVIRINPLLSLGVREYSYTDIVGIDDVLRERAPNGNIFQDPHFVITFKDGFTWNSKESGYGEYVEDKDIIARVIEKSQVTPRKVEFGAEDR